MKEEKMKRTDLLFIVGLVVAGFIFAGIYLLFSQNGSMIQVKINGTVTATYWLSQDGEYRIEAEQGGYNLLKIENGSAYLIDADCPDQLCMGMGKIRMSGQSIICLPHKVVVEVISSPKSENGQEIDGVAR